MDYTDNYDPVPRTLLSYDGELIDGRDAVIRYRRDEELQEKYDEAEAALSDEQMTFDDVKKSLEQNLFK